MSDTPIQEAPLEEFDESGPDDKPGLLADPVVRTLIYVLMGLIILFLASIIGVVATGITTPEGPRSAAERRVLMASSQAGGAGEAAAPYVNALIAAGNLQAARVALAQARTSVNTTFSPDLDLAEARLSSTLRQYEQAVALADKAMNGYEAEREARIAQGGDAATEAKSAGFGEDYYNSALVKAHALTELGRWKDAVATYDIYIRTNPTASDILIDRGNAKAELNDKKGAEKDFRAALRFVPYDEEAKAGLKRIGVAQ